MITRIRYAVQYPPRKTDNAPIYARVGGGTTVDLLCACLHTKKQAKHYADTWNITHASARVVKVRETITREIVE